MKSAVDPVREGSVKDEPTNVRVREEAPHAPAREDAPPSSRLIPALSHRELRMGNKLAEARSLLDKLPPGDSRRRLLLAAQARQDEVLLDAILSTLNQDYPIR